MAVSVDAVCGGSHGVTAALAIRWWLQHLIVAVVLGEEPRLDFEVWRVRRGVSGVCVRSSSAVDSAYVMANLRGGGEFGRSWHQVLLRLC
jgi:hypothetical protein